MDDVSFWHLGRGHWEAGDGCKKIEDKDVRGCLSSECPQKEDRLFLLLIIFCFEDTKLMFISLSL